MSCSLGCVSLQQWLVNGGHTADLWQNCTSGSVFHCLTSSTNGECSQQAGLLLPLTFYPSPGLRKSRGIWLCRLFVIPSGFFLHACSPPPFPLASSALPPHEGQCSTAVPLSRWDTGLAQQQGNCSPPTLIVPEVAMGLSMGPRPTAHHSALLPPSCGAAPGSTITG